MNTSVIVNIVLCVLTFIFAAISVITVVLVLRQNSKMIENSTRPYITVYFAITDFQSSNLCLCIQNFGQSSALIKNIECDHNLTEYSCHGKHIPFSRLPGSFLAPGQSFIYNLDTAKLLAQPHLLTFAVEYASGSKKYKDAFTLNPQANLDLM